MATHLWSPYRDDRCRVWRLCLYHISWAHSEDEAALKEGSPHILATKHIAARLLHTREALGLNQREFAMRANLKPNRYSQYETRVRALTIDAALRICDKYGVSLDWLYRGERSRLPYHLACTYRSWRALTLTINH